MGKKLKFVVTVANQFTEQIFSFGVVTQDKKSSVNSFETILYFSGLGLSSWDFCQNSWFHLFYFIFLFIFLFWKTLICWRYLNWTKFRCSWNSFWTCSLWSLGGCCWSFRSKWIADIIGLSAAFGCWVVLSLFRRRSELCNNFQFGDVLLM